MHRLLCAFLLFWLCLRAAPDFLCAQASPQAASPREFLSPDELVDFLSRLVPALNLPKAKPVRRELLWLIEKNPKLAEKLTVMRKKFYDSKTGILNPEGDLLAKQIAGYVREGQEPRSALELLHQISEASPLLLFEPGKRPAGAHWIGEIRLETKDVFDPSIPEEDWAIFRLANWIHNKTNDEVIRRELLFKPGDRLDPLLIQETERNLRAFSFIKNAEIVPSGVEDGKLDLKVKTQDSWTTLINLGFGAEGGESKYAAGASELNLLGRGKALGFDWSRQGAVRQSEVRYLDPALLGSRERLIALFADTNQGQQKGLDLYHPFYSLRTPASYSATYVDEAFEANLYAQGGGLSSSFTKDHFFQKANYSFKLDKEEDSAKRFHLNYIFQEDRFFSTADTAPGTLPQNRRLSGPVFGYTWTQAGFLKERNIDKIQRPEDFNLGHQLSLQAGYLPTVLGSDRNRTFFEISDAKGISWGPGFFALGQAGIQSRVLSGRLENGLFYGNLNFYRRLSRRLPQTVVLHLEGAHGRNLDGENQLRLGGDSGMRGYKLNSLTGNKSLMANLEWRISHPREFFRLIHFGAAAFLDAASVAPQGKNFSAENFKSDLGLGLRISPSRSSAGSVVRIDLAYALNPVPGQSRWILSLVTGQAFGLSNSALRGLLGDSASELRSQDPSERQRSRRR